MEQKIHKLISLPLYRQIEHIDNYLQFLNIDFQYKNLILQSHNILKKYITTNEISIQEKEIVKTVYNIIINKNYPKSTTISPQETNEVKPISINTVSNIIDVNILISSLKSNISKIYLLKMPIYSLTLFYSNNHEEFNKLLQKEELDYLAITKKIMEMSNKEELEEILLKDTNAFIHFYINVLIELEKDLQKTLNTNQKLLNVDINKIQVELNQTFEKYNRSFINKFNELYMKADRLYNYVLATQETTGNIVQKVVKNGSLGVIGASLFGPLGIAAAVGLSYMSEKDEAEKQNQIFEKNYDDWAIIYDKIYTNMLPEYYIISKELSHKLAEYPLKLVLGLYNNLKSNEMKNLIATYMQNELKLFSTSNELIEMIEESANLENFFK